MCIDIFVNLISWPCSFRQCHYLEKKIDEQVTNLMFSEWDVLQYKGEEA
jgi:hypothetical protein